MTRTQFVAWGLVCAGLVVAFLALPHKNTVVLTEHGFSPRELTVSLGETVTFVNKRDKYFWPASDFHPTHTAYPAFDAREALAPGASWSFVFEEPGLFKYHDHLAPFYFGIVRVRDEEGHIVDHCTNRGGDLACWQDQIFATLAHDGIGAAYAMVGTLYREEAGFAASCHYIAHNIGLASYGLYREDPESFFSPQASACGSGFYHGFMEAYLGATGDVKSASEVCGAVGSALADEAPDARYQCYHGIGHGAMELIVASGGVFSSLEEMTDRALVECEKASTGVEERFRCASGLFNGIANFYINGEYGLSVDKQNPLALCARQEEMYKEACYGNMNSVLYWMHGNVFGDAARAAIQYVEPEYIEETIAYIAGLYAYDSLPTFSAESVAHSCQSLDAHVDECIRGFAHGLLEHGAPGSEYEKGVEFCQRAPFSAHERDVCYTETLSELTGWYSLEKSRAICADLPLALQTYCANI